MPAQQFYRYRDARGKVVVVDSLDRVPEAERAKVERLVFEAPPKPLIEQPSLPALAEFSIHWQSFGAGFAAAVLLGAVVMGLRRFSSPIVRVAFFAIGLVFAAGAYLGWLRRSTGVGDGLLASPSAVVDDARRAVDAVNRRNQKQKEQLDEIMRTK